MAKRKSKPKHSTPTQATTLFGDTSFDNITPSKETQILETEAEATAMQYTYPKIPRKYWIAVGKHKTTNESTLVINTTEFTPSHFLSTIAFPCTQIHDIYDIYNDLPAHLYFKPFVKGGYLTIINDPSYCVAELDLGNITKIISLHTLDDE